MKNDVFQVFDSIGAFGGMGGHNPLENGVLQNFQKVLSLNIDDTELDLGCTFVSISRKLGRTVVSIENRSCIVFGSIRPKERGVGRYTNSINLENENLTTNFAEIR